ncbi:baseplate assembly protein [Aeromonas phage 59.1]|nr:baseplate assembly protein [Aeromonas phage 59.1]
MSESNAIRVMSRITGGNIDGLDSLRQRIGDCLSFPRGALVGRRGYGSDVIEMLDRNMGPSFAMSAFMAVSEALKDPDNGLPDFQMTQVGISAVGDNWVEMVIAGSYVPNQESVTLEGIRIGGN